ncbi:MAG: hypothetical protein GKS06_02100 [Acidobacteria bacterium]|nr:hypothetical protein [Acidobacteriota bacterium]
MRSRMLLGGLLVLFAAHTSVVSAQQRPDPESPRFKGVVALQTFFGSEGDEALQTFVDDHVATTMRDELGDELLNHLATLRETFAGQESRGARPTGPLGATMMYPDNKSVSFALDPEDPARFMSIATDT